MDIRLILVQAFAIFLPSPSTRLPTPGRPIVSATRRPPPSAGPHSVPRPHRPVRHDHLPLLLIIIRHLCSAGPSPCLQPRNLRNPRKGASGSRSPARSPTSRPRPPPSSSSGSSSSSAPRITDISALSPSLLEGLEHRPALHGPDQHLARRLQPHPHPASRRQRHPGRAPVRAGAPPSTSGSGPTGSSSSSP
ncbi:MAG: hypothetical protein M0C28_15225 [Candidatus Moduliflexus flocculans]|nr:hypothetical protein [Candidatus Moduliflexus flocculans]